MDQPDPAGTERGTERIEAFSDGVFAIAITLLILEVRVPHPPGTTPVDLLSELLRLWPSYFALVLSFVMIGIYWANHHYIFKLFEKTNHTLNLLNLLFLLCISFLPFPTAVLGSYMLDQANQTTAAAFYAVGLLLPAASWMLMWLYAGHGQRLVDHRLESVFLRRLTLKYVGSVAVYSIAVLVSLVAFKLGLAICVGLTLLYLAPPHFPAYSNPTPGD
jgi:TMEM175 potassium channel family protein